MTINFIFTNKNFGQIIPFIPTVSFCKILIGLLIHRPQSNVLVTLAYTVLIINKQTLPLHFIGAALIRHGYYHHDNGYQLTIPDGDMICPYNLTS